MLAPPIVLFDLDGTLTDPKVGITVSLQVALAAVGVEVDDPDELSWCIGPPLLESMAALGVTGERATIALAAYRERYDVLGAYENEVYDGIPELLGSLVSDGRRLAVATSKPEPIATAIIEHFGLADHFRAVAGASLDQIRSTKAQVVARALALLGSPAPADAVLVGDRVHDVEGARAEGVASIAVTWGYAHPGELVDAGPDAIVSDIATLARALGLT